MTSVGALAEYKNNQMKTILFLRACLKIAEIFF